MMFTRCSLFVLLLVQVLVASNDVHGFGMAYSNWQHRETVRQQQVEQALNCLKERGNTFKPNEEYIVQPLDHFDAQNERTFSQRYYVKAESWKNPDGPVILYIGGEGPLGLHWTDVTRCAGASYMYPDDALVFSVEHRFYGNSIIKDGLLLENLKYLSSEQELADLAVFRQAMTLKYNLTSSNKWIATGGSYAGSLAAWVRIKYPHLIHASVASSAPVKAVVDFTAYNDVVARSYGQPLVHGSDECVAAIKDAFQAIDSLIQHGKLEQLAKDFQSCYPLQSELDVNLFVMMTAGKLMSSVQYMYDYQDGLFEQCAIMTDSNATAYENLLRYIFQNLPQDRCTDYSFQKFVSWLMRTDYSSIYRQWFYQTCTEFGYSNNFSRLYEMLTNEHLTDQTCELNTSCPFSYHSTLKLYFVLCSTVYNITTQRVYDRVDFTNTYYGSDHPQASRIIFVNGLIDPWHALSVLEDLSSSVLAIVIPQTAHCADMRVPTQDDPPELTAARQRTRLQIEAWLKE